MKELLEKFKESFDQNEYNLGVQASDAEIKAAEQALGLSFPEEYRNFLKSFGWLEIYNNYFFGLPNNPLGAGSAIAMTIYARKHWALPSEYIVVYSSEDQVLWCLNCQSAEGKVISYNSETKKIETIVAPNLERLLMDYLEL